MRLRIKWHVVVAILEFVLFVIYAVVQAVFVMMGLRNPNAKLFGLLNHARRQAHGWQAEIARPMIAVLSGVGVALIQVWECVAMRFATVWTGLVKRIVLDLAELAGRKIVYARRRQESDAAFVATTLVGRERAVKMEYAQLQHSLAVYPLEDAM